MEKVDIGYLRVVATKRGVLKDCVITDLSFTSLDVPAGLYNIDNEQCYLVKKADLDAYMASEESLEKTKGTLDWYLSNRIKQLEAENANLRDINKSLGEENSKLVEKDEALEERNTKLKCMVDKFYGMTSAGEELRAANEKLAAEVDELKEQCDILRKDYIVRGQTINDLKKELKELKSKTVAEARYEWKPNCFAIIYTMCDGSKQTIGMDSSEGIDATSISCGTVPKCSSCAHYMHNPSRFAHDWCYMPIPKEGGAGYIRKLNKEEAEGPACSDFKAKE